MKVNVGHGKAKNIGLEKCTHELVAIMDSDICTNDRFEKQLIYFKNISKYSGGIISEFNKNINISLGKEVYVHSFWN